MRPRDDAAEPLPQPAAPGRLRRQQAWNRLLALAGALSCAGAAIAGVRVWQETGEGLYHWDYFTAYATGSMATAGLTCLALQDRLAGLDDDAVVGLAPILAADVTEERHHLPGSSEPTAIILRQGGALGRAVQVGTVTAALAGVADGELSVTQIAAAVSSLSGLDQDGALQVRAEMVESVRDLARMGFLTLR